MSWQPPADSDNTVLQQIMQSLQEGIAVFDTNLKCQIWNRYFEWITGKSSVDVIGKVLPGISTLFDDERIQERLEQALRGESREPIEISYKNGTTGQSGWLLLTISPLKNLQGEIDGVLLTVREITDRNTAEEYLRKNEAQLVVASQIARLGYWEYDVSEGYFTFNDQFYSVFKTTVEKIGGYKVTPERYAKEFLHPDDQYVIAEEMKNAMQAADANYCRQLEHRILFGNGETGYIAVCFFIVKDEQGRTVKTYGVNQDITERKLSEIRLMESEKKLATLMSNLSGMVYQCKNDEHWTMLFVNDACRNITGYEPEQLILNRDVSYAKIIHPADRARVNTNVKEMLKKGKQFEFEYRIIAKDGMEKWVWERGIGTKPDKGGEVFLEGVVHDITGRKTAEKALRENERKYRMLLNKLDDAVFLYPLLQEGFGTFDEVNRAACRRYGYSIEEFKKFTIQDITAQRIVKTKGNTDTHKELAKDGRHTYEIMHMNKNGRRFPVEISTNFITIKNKEYALSLVRDISERKQTEKEHEHLQIQLAQAQKMESIGRLAGGIAHDFNNMLGVILGNVEFALQQSTQNQALRTDLSEIQKAAQRSAELTGQLLAFARKQTVAPKVLDMNDTLSGMLKMLQRIMGENIELVWIPAPQIWPVKMDPGQISHVLVNLCVNARDAIKVNGKVIIETLNVGLDESFCEGRLEFVPGEYVALIVTDNGCGMENSIKERIFEPFFTTKKIGEGTGLGLSTVYGVVKQNNGFVYVYSEPGQGATFKIYFPRYLGKSDKVSSSGAKQDTAVAGETVLVVEDEQSILLLSKRMLETLGYRVLTALTPGEAMKIAEQHAGQIDLLMTDVVMPEMDGRELAKKLISLYPGMKRLFVSGYTANVIAHRGVLEEGIHFLQKPFSMQELGKKVEEALDGKTRAHSSPGTRLS